MESLETGTFSNPHRNSNKVSICLDCLKVLKVTMVISILSTFSFVRNGLGSALENLANAIREISQP